MRRFPRIETWEQWFVAAVVIVAAITAVLHAAFRSFPDWAVTSVLFLAAFTIMVQNQQLLRSAQSITKEFRDSDDRSKLDSILTQLVDNASAVRSVVDEFANWTTVRIHANYDEFYRDLRISTERARDMVRASYMRRFPPDKLGGEAEAFFESSLNWARGNAHHLRRIVCRPDEDALLTWVRDQDKKSQEAGSHYLIRVVDWTVREVDALSVAIIDDDVVFFAFSGSEDVMRGFSLRNREVAGYFIDYHNQLWQSSEPLGQFLARQGAPRK